MPIFPKNLPYLVCIQSLFLLWNVSLIFVRIHRRFLWMYRANQTGILHLKHHVHIENSTDQILIQIENNSHRTSSNILLLGNLFMFDSKNNHIRLSLTDDTASRSIVLLSFIWIRTDIRIIYNILYAGYEFAKEAYVQNVCFRVQKARNERN